jgi:DNA invertase Pin-like site-specific DNA recombinase
MTARRMGISYFRFSKAKQAKGDSEDRQERDYRGFCQRHNLTPYTADDYVDRGRSGYHDEHRKKGKLGKLIAAARDGRFDRDDVIVVEAWDRLGRLRPDKQINLLQELLQTGVQIGVCRLDDIFTEADFGTHKWTTLSVFVQLAYQESKQKADRGASAWRKRRERARQEGAVMTARLPGWLMLVNGQIVPRPERVAAIRRIFALAAAGYGHKRIIRALMAEGIPPFGSPCWTLPYIGSILNDRRVLGELRTRRSQESSLVLEGYYPAIVSPEEYALARASQRGRRGRKGPRDRKHVNLFQSLLISALDGESFQLANRGTAKKPQLILRNTAGHEGRAREQTFPYPIFEEAICQALCEINPADILPAVPAPDRIGVLRAQLANIRGDIAGLQADLQQGYSKGLAAVLRQREQEEERIAGELQDELAASVRPAERAWEQLPSLVDLIRAHGDEARLKIRPVLRSIVSEARLLLVKRGCHLLAATQLFFTGGAVRHYLIIYRPAARHRPQAWWCPPSPYDEVTDPAELDLRRPQDAAALERVLAEMDLERFRPNDMK